MHPPAQAQGRSLAVTGHLMPPQVVFPDSVPRTVAGKAEPVRLSREAGSPPSPAALTTPTQELVARVRSEGLGLPVESADADFFELGGRSLIATQVVAPLVKDSARA